MAKKFDVGTRVRINSEMKEFIGKTGTVTGHESLEKFGGPHHRVRFDTPVEVNGIGKVTSDLWQREHMTKLKEGNEMENEYTLFDAVMNEDVESIAQALDAAVRARISAALLGEEGPEDPDEDSDDGYDAGETDDGYEETDEQE